MASLSSYAGGFYLHCTRSSVALQTQCRWSFLEMLKRFWLIWTLDGFLNHGFDGWRSPELATVVGYYGVSLDGCSWCVEASSELVGLSATCRKSMPGSAETHGLFTGTSRSVLQCPGSFLCWWPLCVDVLPLLKCFSNKHLRELSDRVTSLRHKNNYCLKLDNLV